MDYIQFFMEIIGTISFASSGAMVAMRKEMDIFGVAVLATTTACGGGLIRDLVLGIIPPNIFLHPIYSVISCITAIVIFSIFYFNENLMKGRIATIYDEIMQIFDMLGLGIFTVVGVNTAFYKGFRENIFLLVFVGVVTGVGGGMLRDIMAQTKPMIFTKNIYAVASLAGAICYIELRDYFTELSAMVLATTLVCVIRMLAIGFDWNLPKVKLHDDQLN